MATYEAWAPANARTHRLPSLLASTEETYQIVAIRVALRDSVGFQAARRWAIDRSKSHI
jgi:hypothetical protein